MCYFVVYPFWPDVESMHWNSAISLAGSWGEQWLLLSYDEVEEEDHLEYPSDCDGGCVACVARHLTIWKDFQATIKSYHHGPLLSD